MSQITCETECQNNNTVDSRIISRLVPESRCGKKFLPDDLLNNNELNTAIDFSLPKNYTFEIHKTLWRIKQDQSKHIGLQFPEGLLIFAGQIALLITHFTSHPIEVTILGDVTYGACCIDDLTARSIGIDLLVHYGHSCLIPIEQLSIQNCLYIFVDIVLDYQPLVSAVKLHFPNDPNLFHSHSAMSKCVDNERSTIPNGQNATTIPITLEESPKNNLQTVPQNQNHESTGDQERNFVIGLMGTIQYSSVIHAAAECLREYYGEFSVYVPQELPLTAGEVLGCTSPKLLGKVNIVIFVSDGRFHLESALIQNPGIPFYRYDPFTKKLYREQYNHTLLHNNRQSAIAKAQKATSIGIILGTLGRQGSVGIFERLRKLLKTHKIQITLLMMSEISPDRLIKLGTNIQAFIQVGCPRLSIDWGHCISQTPLLTPYEAFVAFGNYQYQSIYPMDYYSRNGGAWTNFQQEHRSGSIAPAIAEPFSNLDERRALIRRRAEERRKRALPSS